jgi:F-type H+-transporting ATPase subunit delta
MHVTVYSKKALTQSEKERLITRLKKKHNRDIELKNMLDESIVGGLKVEYEGYVLDDTINNYLQNLKATLKA